MRCLHDAICMQDPSTYKLAQFQQLCDKTSLYTAYQVLPPEHKLPLLTRTCGGCIRIDMLNKNSPLSHRGLWHTVLVSF